MPGFKVNRSAYLSSLFEHSLSEKQLQNVLRYGPQCVAKMDELDKLAEVEISRHAFYATTTSFAAGIPGGMAILGTLPMDIVQYYYHVLKLSQKMAYIYGYPDLTDSRENLDRNAADSLIIFIGVAFAVQGAAEAINTLARVLSEQIIKKVPQVALTKSIIYPIIKNVARWFGVQITKKSFARGLAKAVPIVGGIVSGGLTYATFKPCAKRLQIAFQNYAKLSSVEIQNNLKCIEDIEYEEI